LIRFEGKDVLTELRELASPAARGPAARDMQQDFVAAGWRVRVTGHRVVSMYAEIRPRLAGLASRRRRRHGVLVVHIQNTALPAG